MVFLSINNIFCNTHSKNRHLSLMALKLLVSGGNPVIYRVRTINLDKLYRNVVNNKKIVRMNIF